MHRDDTAFGTLLQFISQFKAVRGSIPTRRETPGRMAARTVVTIAAWSCGPDEHCEKLKVKVESV